METKLNILDNLEMLSVENQKSDFPEHFHETFCISFVEKGMEAIKMQDTTIYSEAGSITINNPYEIHANPIVDKDNKVSFETIYLSQDLVDHLTNLRGQCFQNRQIRDKEVITNFQKLRQSIHNKADDIESNLSDFLQSLTFQNQYNTTINNPFSSVWSEIILFIKHHLEEKITLEMLARFMCMDKYNFAKQFRVKFGMSPMNYVLMKKIFAAKKLITPHTDLTALAYQFEFSDQAHFSKTFKRFVGMSPRHYKKQILS